MDRYENTKIKKKNRKLHSYNTTMMPSFEEKNSDMYFIATEGDRCDLLAHRFYGDSTLWWVIAKVNNLSTMNIPAGTSLRIPTQI